eukprot:2217258-Pyramimonas_sp.AAC.1
MGAGRGHPPHVRCASAPRGWPMKVTGWRAAARLRPSGACSAGEVAVSDTSIVGAWRWDRT